MDRNQATGLFLISALLLIYLAFFAPKGPKPKPVDPKAKIEMPAVQAARRAADEVALAPLAPAVSAARVANLGAFAAAAATTEGTPIVLENANLRLELSPRGGLPRAVRLKNYVTFEKQPLDLLSPQTGALDVVLPLAGGKTVRLSQLEFAAVNNATQVTLPSGQKAQRWVLAADLGNGQRVTQTYELPADAFTVDYALRLEGLNNVVAANKNATLTWAFNPTRTERVLKQNRAAVTVNYRTAAGAFEHIAEGSANKDDSTAVSEPITWFTHKLPFFNAGLIAVDQPFAGADLRTHGLATDSTVLRHLRASVSLPVSGLTSATGGRYQFFFGPNDYKLLTKVAPDYGRNVYLGWGFFGWINKGLIIPIFHFLENLFTGPGRYGLIIVVLVLVVKTLLFPLTYKSYVSMAKMRVLKPEIDEIKARLGEENTTAVQAETMQLYQEMGVSPLAGCIPTLATIPILLAMFNFFPGAIELRQEGFLWATDLSSYDEFARLPFTIPFYGSHVSLFTLLMTATTLVLTWQNNQTSAMQGAMKFYSYLMPLIFMFVLNDFAAGLTWYYLVSNVVTIGQQMIIRKMVDDDSLRAKLEANRVKHLATPADQQKKPSFQARLAEAMKNAQQQAAEQKALGQGKGRK
ncbi:MAG: membrane protein insertase YidC [Hymenobacteraceae bacterium]|nr:membrane protein insertase YidC [Hymenobacteraceae bacterium]